MTRPLRTSDIAKAVGVHPNTVRLYEVWGFLPTIPRNASGYRLFTEAHLNQMRLARTALQGPWPGRSIKRVALALVRQAASGDLGGALEQAYIYLSRVRAERAQSEAAVELLERWAHGIATDATAQPLLIGPAAELLGVTRDMLRNWERNGLIQVPRDPRNGYRLYGAAEIGRLRVIRMLSRAGYSTMAILRMLLYLDQGSRENLRAVLDTPGPDEDIYSAADQWLSTLVAQEQHAVDTIAQLEEMIRKRQE
ncbi:MAG: MerR family transcriptional regulator [Chloroflexi bacterium]|nr:MerR family transcriptional regulator [Chloroflexota bacterium]MBU1752172.1 MerR family transcriptional regulator [Chloroflexota bacterium]MBU1880141.1 MerR family transcriptional regulator [Chloroflexota bacterium]